MYIKGIGNRETKETWRQGKQGKEKIKGSRREKSVGELHSVHVDLPPRIALIHCNVRGAARMYSMRP